MAGCEKKASRHFFCKKMANEDVSLLHAFVPTKALHSKPKVFFTSSSNTREDLLVKTFALLTCEVADCRRVDVFLFSALRLHGGKPP